MIGQTLGHYRIEAKLGEGGMGVVYKARDAHLDRFVAIKVLPPESVADAERKRRFVQEAKAASALNHANIVTIHDINTDGGIDFIAMEYVPGRTLDRLLGPRGLPLRDALHCAIQIADALAAAHEAGIVHRDLKPGNIMITEQGHVKLLDFGLAKLTEPDTNELAPTETMRPQTGEGRIVGTVAYMSPEQAQGKKLDARSDIFSFGVVLYEMLSGRRPFQGGSTIETLSAIVQNEPKPIAEQVCGVPRDLERIVVLALRKHPDRRFQHMADVKIQLLALKEESDSGKLVAVPATIAPAARRRLTAGAAVLLAGVAIGAIFWSTNKPQPAAEHPTLTRLTSDSGLTTDAALSPDGKLLAFASDRGGDDHLHIWVRQVAAGDPLRLTAQSDNSEPSFSPDGTHIAFRSESYGGGVYVIPALGGEPRLLARSGRRPRYSPDGKWVAYWVGEPHHPTGEIFVVDSEGGPPRKLQLRPPLMMAKYPTWSSNGRYLLFLGSERAPDPQTLDWWTCSVKDGVALRTGAFEVFRRQKLPTSAFVTPGEWRNDQVLFSARTGDSTALWRLPLPVNSLQAIHAAKQITFSTGFHVGPSAAVAGQLAFASLAENIDIWSLHIDANEGKPIGEPQRLTSDAALDLHPSVTADGKKMVFRSDRSGNADIWMKDLQTGRESRLTVDPGHQGMPLIAGDGSRIAFESVEGGKRVHSLLSADPRSYSDAGEKICDAACGYLSDVSSDGSFVLDYQFDVESRRGALSTVDVRSGLRSILVGGDSSYPVDPRFSADGRWVAFHHQGGFLLPLAPRRQIFLARFRVGAPAPRSEWIPITDGSAMDRFPAFSPDGNLLYFISERDGFRCVAAQRLDPATKRRSGPMFYVHHFHGARRSMMNFLNPNWSRISVARDRIVFSLGERTGNIWMMQLPDLN